MLTEIWTIHSSHTLSMNLTVEKDIGLYKSSVICIHVVARHESMVYFILVQLLISEHSGGLSAMIRYISLIRWWPVLWLEETRKSPEETPNGLSVARLLTCHPMWYPGTGEAKYRYREDAFMNWTWTHSDHFDLQLPFNGGGLTSRYYQYVSNISHWY